MSNETSILLVIVLSQGASGLHVSFMEEALVHGQQIQDVLFLAVVSSLGRNED